MRHTAVTFRTSDILFYPYQINIHVPPSRQTERGAQHCIIMIFRMMIFGDDVRNVRVGHLRLPHFPHQIAVQVGADRKHITIAVNGRQTDLMDIRQT